MSDNDKVGGPQIEVGLDVKDAKTGAKDLGKSLDDTAKSALKMGEGISTSERAVGSLVRTIKNLGAEVAQKKVDNLSVAVEKLGGTAKMTGAQIEFLQNRLDKLQSAGAKVPANLQEIASSANKIKAAVLALGAQQLSGLNNQFGAMGSILSALGPGGIALGASLGLVATTATAVYEAVKISVKELADYGMQVERMHSATGLSVAESQKMVITVGALGGNAQLSAQMFARLASAIEDENPALKRLGLNFLELRRMSPDDQLNAVTTALDNVANATDRIDIERKLFGRGGAQIELLLENLKSVSEFATKAGLVMSEEDVTAAKNLAIAGGELEQAWKGVEREFAAGFMNGTEFRKSLEDMAPAIQLVGQLARGAGIAMSAMSPVGQLSKISPELERIKTTLQSFGLMDTDLPQDGKAPSKGFLASHRSTSDGGLPDAPDKATQKQAELQAKRALRELERQEANDRKADNEFDRESIRLKEELEKALYKEADGLTATIGAIKARHEAERSKYTSEEAVYTPAQRDKLVEMSQKTEEAEVAGARLAASHKSAALAAQFQAETEKLLAGQLTAGMTPLGVSIAALDKEHSAVLSKIRDKLALATVSGTVDQAVLKSAVAEMAAADASHKGAVEQKVAAELKKADVSVTKEEVKVQAELSQARAKGHSDLAADKQAIDDKIEVQQTSVDLMIGELQQQQYNVKGDFERVASLQALINRLKEVKGQLTELGDAEKSAAALKHVLDTLKNLSGVIGLASDKMQEFGIIGEGTASKLKDVQEGIGGLTQILADPSNPLNDIAGGIHILSAAADLFGFKAKPEWEKVGEELGTAFGSHWTEATAKAIVDTAHKLNVSDKVAELLSLDKIMADNPGMDPAKWRSQMQELAYGIVHGLVPAELGVQALGKDFTALKDAADKGSAVSQQAMIQIIHTAKQLGLVVPEIEDALRGFVKDAVDNLKALYSGQNSKFGGKDGKELIGGQVSAEQAAANQTIFGAVFDADVALNGLITAADDTKDAFDALTNGLPDGTKLTGSAGEAGVVNQALQNPLFRGAATSAAAGAKILSSLEKGDFLNQKTMDAFGVTIKTGMDQAFKGTDGMGLSDDERRKLAEEANLPLLTQAQHAEALGLKLDDGTRAMLAQAHHDGILPALSVAEQSLLVLKQIRDGKTGDGGNNSSGPRPGGNLPSSPSNYQVPSGAAEHGVSVPHFDTGGKLPYQPGGRIFVAGESEDEFIFRKSQLKNMKGGGSHSISMGGITVVAAPGQDPRAIADAVSDVIERRLSPRLLTLLKENS